MQTVGKDIRYINQYAYMFYWIAPLSSYASWSRLLWKIHVVMIYSNYTTVLIYTIYRTGSAYLFNRVKLSFGLIRQSP
jgi:hypothetical protein